MTNPTRTVAVAKDGKETEIHGREVPIKTQRAYCRAAKISPLPKGALRVEMWERVWQTVGGAAAPAAPAEPKADAKS